MKKKKDKSNDLNKMDPYAINKLHKVPFWIKATLLKWWFYGATYFFMMMSITNATENSTSQGMWEWIYIMAGVLCGAFYDLVINKILILADTDKHESNNFSVFISKKYYAMILNIIYYTLVFVLVFILQTYMLPPIMKNFNIKFKFGSEPVTFGILVLIFDYIFLGIKQLIILIIKKIKAKKVIEKNEEINNQ